jgi:hypothetical protein
LRIGNFYQIQRLNSIYGQIWNHAQAVDSRSIASVNKLQLRLPKGGMVFVIWEGFGTFVDEGNKMRDFLALLIVFGFLTQTAQAAAPVDPLECSRDLESFERLKDSLRRPEIESNLRHSGIKYSSYINNAIMASRQKFDVEHKHSTNLIHADDWHHIMRLTQVSSHAVRLVNNIVNFIDAKGIDQLTFAQIKWIEYIILEASNIRASVQIGDMAVQLIKIFADSFERKVFIDCTLAIDLALELIKKEKSHFVRYHIERNNEELRSALLIEVLHGNELRPFIQIPD